MKIGWRKVRAPTLKAKRAIRRRRRKLELLSKYGNVMQMRWYFNPPSRRAMKKRIRRNPRLAEALRRLELYPEGKKP